MKYGIAIVLAAALAACGGQSRQQTGSAQVSIKSRSALSAALTDVTLTVRGPVASSAQPTDTEGVVAPQLADSPFSLGPPPQSKSFDGLPVGWYYVDANSTGYQGHGWLQVTSLHMSTLDIIMQEKAGPPAWSDAAPLIKSIAVSPSDPYYGETIHVSVVAADADGSCGVWGCTTDALTYEWTSLCNGATTSGVFTRPDAEGTDFTSSCHGTEAISIKVTDSKGIFSGASVVVPYSAQGGTVNVGVNHYPTITGITASAAQVNVRQTIDLALDPDDVDGDELTAAWSATCGSFDDATSFTPVWTAPATSGDCTLNVNVYDGHGQYSYAHGSLVVHVNLSLAPFASVCDKTTWACAPTTSGASSYVDASGLHLSKDADNATAAYGVGAEILGAAGMPFTSASFDTTGVVSGGSPRFVLSYAGGRCTLDNASRSGNTYTFTASSTYVPCVTGAGLTGLEIVVDGMGAAQTITLTNVTVNGSPVMMQ